MRCFSDRTLVPLTSVSRNNLTAWLKEFFLSLIISNKCDQVDWDLLVLDFRL